MSERFDWQELRGRLMVESGAADAYDTARLAVELGQRGAGTPCAARIEANGVSQARGHDPSCRDAVQGRWRGAYVPVLQRLDRLLGAELTV